MRFWPRRRDNLANYLRGRSDPSPRHVRLLGPGEGSVDDEQPLPHHTVPPEPDGLPFGTPSEIYDRDEEPE